MKFQKLQAGALQLTLFIAVVIALLLMAFIGVVHAHQRFNLQTDFVVESVENTNRGIAYALQNNLQLNDTIDIGLKDEDYKSLKVYKDYWGIFEKTTAISIIKNHKFHKTALIGAKQPKNDRLALYVEDNNKPLVVVGNTRIQGIAYLPKRGVKSGNISGNSYYGDQLIFGQIRTSQSLPKLKTETWEQIRTITNINKEINQNYFLDVGNNNVFINSFSNPTQMIFSNDTIDLSFITLTGNMMVHSQTKIIVAATSKLKDVILIAPEIQIMDNASGSFQVFATTTIMVGKGCKLNYPTALVIDEKEVVFQQSQSQQLQITSPIISVGEGSIIKGVVAYLGQANNNNYSPQVVVEENANVIGEVYCNVNVELKGTVSGTVFTSNFVANQSGSIYQNHIYNGRIIVDELPQEYVGLEFEDSKKEVMKWLY